MAIILGVFDLLAYAVPGSLYLSVFAYTSHRAGWIDVPSLLGLPSVLLLIAVAVAAFLTGQASYPLGSMIDRINPFGSIDLPVEAKEGFTGDLPVFAGLTGLVLALVAAGCLHQSATFRRWAIIRTGELPSGTTRSTEGCRRSSSDEGKAAHTLKRNSTTSPSCMPHPSPSMRTQPLAPGGGDEPGLDQPAGSHGPGRDDTGRKACG
jgi:hypothetical protein